MSPKGKVVIFHPKNVLRYNNYPSLGIICVASALEANDYAVKIISQVTSPDDWQSLVKEELDDCLMFCIGALTTEIPYALDAARFVRRIKPAVRIVLGGWHATLLARQAVQSPLIDYAIPGEGDEAVVRLADSILDGTDKKWGVTGNVVATSKVDCENLPFPNYDLWPNLEKFITSYLTDKVSEFHETLRWLPYESSRGCPQECTFCEIQTTENWKFRPKSATKVVREIAEIVSKYRLTHLKIVDDNMPVHVSRMRAIAQGIIETGLGFTYDLEVRANYFREDKLINHEMLDLLYRSGLRQCTLGLESGSQRMLDIMKKGLKVHDGERAVRMLDEHKIIARCSFITGYLGETVGDLRRTVRFINRLRKLRCFTGGVQTFRPYPGTPVTEELKKNKLFYEPKTLEEWAALDNVAMFTYAELNRPWQPNWKLAGAVSFYNSLEMGSRLGKHMIKNRLSRMLYQCFVLLARMRNRLVFYRLQIDRRLYHRFHDRFFNKYEVEYTD